MGSPSSMQTMNKPKAPVMKELPEVLQIVPLMVSVWASSPESLVSHSVVEKFCLCKEVAASVQDLFGPPQAPTAVAPVASNPFGSGSFPGQAVGFAHANVVPNPQQPVAAQQAFHPGPQGFPVNQTMAHNMQQVRIQPGQATPGFSPQPPLPPAPVHTSVHHFPQSPNNSHLITGLTNSEGESDHTLFGNLIEDLRTSLPKPRLHRSESLQYGSHAQVGAHPFGSQQQNRFMTHQAPFPAQQSAFGAPALQQSPFPPNVPHQPVFPGGQQPHQAYMQGHGFGRVQSMQVPGYQPQAGQPYGAPQPGIMGQSPGGLQGGIQSSGNPFA